jgi:SAM-dependent methyltransferase
VATWDERAGWYIEMVTDPERGFNHLAADVALRLAGRLADRDVLDIGSGEGWLARRMASEGARVVATEPTAALLAEAQRREAAEPARIRFLSDPAEDLSGVTDHTVDVAMAVLVLHHVADLDRAVAEAARILRPGGTLVVVIPHPWTNHTGSEMVVTDNGPRLQLGDYAVEQHWHTDEADSVRGIGWHHRTLATWFTTLTRGGFHIDHVEEPLGRDDRRADGGGPWRDIPRFLAIAAQKHAPS